MARRLTPADSLPYPNQSAWRYGLHALCKLKAGRSGHRMRTERNPETGAPLPLYDPGVEAQVPGDGLCVRDSDFPTLSPLDDRPTMFDPTLLEELAAADTKLQAALIKGDARAARRRLDHIFEEKLLVAACVHYADVADTLTAALILKRKETAP